MIGGGTDSTATDAEGGFDPGWVSEPGAGARAETTGDSGADSAGGAVPLQGTIDRVTFQSTDSSYTVLRITPERGFADPEALFATERITAVGHAQTVSDGLRVRLTGGWTVHPSHGRQFAFESLSVLPPLDEAGVVRYLASSTFRGIGVTLAKRIVDELGSDALSKIRADESVLRPVKGLRPDVRAELAAKIRDELDAQEALAFLYGVGLGPAQAERILRAVGSDAEAKIRANPYLMARGISGVGFQTADNVARALGVEPDAPRRREAALLFALGEASGEGHVLQTLASVRGRAQALLGLERTEDEWADDLRALVAEDQVVLDEDVREGAPCVYLPPYHTAEVRLAANLDALLRTAPVRALADDARLAEAEREAGLELHPEQRAAVLGLLREPVGLLTGGPGVGKTTIVRQVVSLAERAGCKVVLASPTGRAAKRLAEATGRDASTLHRLLGWEPGTGRFQHHQSNPIDADLVVVDEISMLDLVLAHHLVKAIQPPTRLVMVGDPDQLPSVSAGNVLADLLACDRIPAYRLTHIYRQAAESLIVENAHRILQGELPRLPERGVTDADFYFFQVEDDDAAADRLIDVVTNRIPKSFGYEWVRDVQVLSPMYKGACGVDEINRRLRDAHGVGGREIHWRGNVWRTGDRVIHTRNDYDKGVFNGDMGWIVGVDADGGALTVKYPEREVRYESKEFSDLKPAFAITVHRSQGGEYKAVAIPVVNRHFKMLQRHLLYTAVTRAKELVVLVGSRRALKRAVENAEVDERQSALGTRMSKLARSTDEVRR